jgi:hypothetical protein
MVSVRSEGMWTCILNAVLSQITVPGSISSQIVSRRPRRKAFIMLDVGITSLRAPSSQLHATLWRCSRCNSFISIHTKHMVDEAFCPVCGDVPLELCGTFNSILGLEFADA